MGSNRGCGVSGEYEMTEIQQQIGNDKAVDRAAIVLEKCRMREKNAISDRRKYKGRNRYSEVIYKSFETIEALLSQGYSVNGVFKLLIDEEVFDINADSSNFYKAFKREKRRRTTVLSNAGVGTVIQRTRQEKKNVPNLSISHHEDGEEYEKSGKKFVMWKGKEIHIPSGFRFMNGRLCPEIREPDDLKGGGVKGEDDYKFSDYPKHIQEAIDKSTREGTVLEDQEKNKQLVNAWIEQQRGKK